MSLTYTGNTLNCLKPVHNEVSTYAVAEYFFEPVRCSSDVQPPGIHLLPQAQQVGSLNAAEGALLGACIGDAAGAPLEFPRSDHVGPDKVRAMLTVAFR